MRQSAVIKEYMVMSDNIKSYESPFCTRYASEEMQYIFSADKKFTTWRKLWVALARAEMKLGLPVTEAQVKQHEKEQDNDGALFQNSPNIRPNQPSHRSSSFLLKNSALKARYTAYHSSTKRMWCTHALPASNCLRAWSACPRRVRS